MTRTAHRGSERIKDRDDEDVCAACKYPAKELVKYKNADIFGPRKDEENLLCELCAKTMTGSYIDYPQQHESFEITILQAINFVGNAILDALERGT